jgi:hypothetical protein
MVLSMRLQRGVPVAGVEPELARSIARACHDRWSPLGQISYEVRVAPQELAPLVGQLEQAGFLESRSGPHTAGGERAWNTTLAGGALTMASFLRPITRAKADALLAGVLERAAAYNSDDTKPYRITEIAVFGSYIRPDVTDFGDLDLAVTFGPRRPDSDSTDALLAHAHASGRRFNTFLDRLFFSREELLRTLRARSGYINVHIEDIARFTDSSRVVFTADAASPGR